MLTWSSFGHVAREARSGSKKSRTLSITNENDTCGSWTRRIHKFYNSCERSSLVNAQGRRTRYPPHCLLFSMLTLTSDTRLLHYTGNEYLSVQARSLPKIYSIRNMTCKLSVLTVMNIGTRSKVTQFLRDTARTYRIFQIFQTLDQMREAPSLRSNFSRYSVHCTDASHRDIAYLSQKLISFRPRNIAFRYNCDMLKHIVDILGVSQLYIWGTRESLSLT